MIVTVAGLFIALAALLLTAVETWDAAMLAAVLFGGGFGPRLAADDADAHRGYRTAAC
jgi:Na+/glutamate symporter